MILLPPDYKDVEKIKALVGKEAETEAAVFNKMVRNLQSRNLQHIYLNEQKHFNGNLVVKPPRKKSFHASVSSEGNNSDNLAEIVNGFVAFVNDHTIHDYVDAAKVKVSTRKAAIQNRIDRLRGIAKKDRQDKIAVLQDAYSIARKLGIRDIAADLVSAPLYLRGTKALSAELETLKQRKEDDPYIRGLNELQIELIDLDKKKFDGSEIKAVRIDQMAMPPQKPIKPKRRLIIVLGLMLGLMSGFFAAFLVNFFENARRREI